MVIELLPCVLCCMVAADCVVAYMCGRRASDDAPMCVNGLKKKKMLCFWSQPTETQKDINLPAERTDW